MNPNPPQPQKSKSAKLDNLLVYGKAPREVIERYQPKPKPERVGVDYSTLVNVFK